MIASSIVFDDVTAEAEFQRLVVDAVSDTYGADDGNTTLVKNAIATMRRIDKPADVILALFVGGTKMCEGPLSEMQVKFNNEVAAHSATVQLKQLERDGSWKTVRLRK